MSCIVCSATNNKITHITYGDRKSADDRTPSKLLFHKCYILYMSRRMTRVIKHQNDTLESQLAIAMCQISIYYIVVVYGSIICIASVSC